MQGETRTGLVTIDETGIGFEACFVDVLLVPDIALAKRLRACK
jgi:hypothetical protein